MLHKFVLISCCLVFTICCQAQDRSTASEVENNSKSVFSIYVNYGNFMLQRNSEGFSSPLIKNNSPSFGAGIMTPLVNTKNYSFKFYLGYQQYNISEEYISAQGSSFTSEVQFNAIHSSIHPISLAINFKDVKVYLGGGGYVNYNLNNSTTISPAQELNVREDLFNPLGYGIIGQAGISFRSIGFEVNGYNSMSDIIDSDIDESIGLIGITAQLVYSF